MLRPKAVAVQPEPHIPWEVDGSVLTVGSGEETVVVDLQERQTDSETVIEICRCEGGLMEGVCGSYVLSIEIPPRRYREETTEPDGSGEGTPVTPAPEPLDIASVVLRLWTVDVDENTEIETEEI